MMEYLYDGKLVSVIKRWCRLWKFNVNDEKVGVNDGKLLSMKIGVNDTKLVSMMKNWYKWCKTAVNDKKLVSIGKKINDNHSMNWNFSKRIRTFKQWKDVNIFHERAGTQDELNYSLPGKRWESKFFRGSLFSSS